MTYDHEDIENEAAEFAKEMIIALAIHGPRGQALSEEFSKVCNGAHAMDIIVAMNIIRCFLEDTCLASGDLADTNEIVYQYIRNQIDKNHNIRKQ